MIGLEEFFPNIPQPGWPGRRKAIARELFKAAVELAVFLLAMLAIFGSMLLVAAAMDVLP